MKLATVLMWIMAGLAVVNSGQRVARSAEPDGPTFAGTGAILYLGYSLLAAKGKLSANPAN